MGVAGPGTRPRTGVGRSRMIRRMQIDVTVPLVVGVVTFLVLAAGLGFVRQVGHFRPHAKSDD